MILTEAQAPDVDSAADQHTVRIYLGGIKSMFKWKKAAATLLAAAVTGSFVACGESTANAMTIDGIQIKAGMYIYYSYNAYL